MRPALFASLLVCLAACATEPMQTDRVALEEQRTTIPAYLIHPEIDYPLDVHSVVGQVHAIDPPLTAICRDGWFSYSQHRSETCGGHGGVAEWVSEPAH